MSIHAVSRILAAVAMVAAASAAAAGPRALGPLDGRPDAIVDIATPAGVALIQGQWRYSDTRIVETDFRAPGPDLKPSGAPITTYDFTPHAGAAGFDDSAWPAIPADTLDARRATGTEPRGSGPGRADRRRRPAVLLPLGARLPRRDVPAGDPGGPVRAAGRPAATGPGARPPPRPR